MRGPLAFIELADEILEKEPEELDTWVAQQIQSGPDPANPVGPDWLATAALDLTALGGTALLALMVIIVAAYLAVIRDRRNMWLVILATTLGQALSSTLKAIFDRPRPDPSLHLEQVSTASFPSGHAMVGAIVYLTLGAVLATTRKRKRERIFIIAAAFLITAIIGLTRIYIGVHYTTDVLAGWSVGLAWTLLCLITAQRLRPNPTP